MTNQDHVTTTRWLVSGRVQGVGFRWFVTRAADECEILAGTARNLADGRVEVVARAGAAQLERLERQLRRGPSGSRVDDVARETLAASPELEPGFRVVRW